MMRYRKDPAPAVCPGCGRPVELLMCSISGKHLETDTDWGYMCVSCRNLAGFGKLPGTGREATKKRRADALLLLERIVTERPDIDIVQILRGLLL